MHPSPKKLQDLVQGTIDEAEVDQIVSHLEQCPPCEDTVVKLEAEEQTLVSRLKKPVTPDPFEQEPECDEFVSLVEAIGRDRSFDPAGTAKVGDEEAEALGSIGQYQLLEKLGEGGMGAVYKAMHTHLEKVVVLKVLRAEQMANETAVNRFNREMKAVGKLNHVNIVAAHDAGLVDGTHFLVMEIVDGDDLSKVVRKRGPLPIPDACEVIRQAAVGLQHANENGLVHRDIKPSNLMLTKDGQVKILDMGLSLLDTPFGGDDGLTSVGQMMGTVDFMAPEQVADSHGVDIRADIYSLGCSLYCLLCGVAPFQDGNYPNLIFKGMAHVQAPPPPIGDRRAGLPAELIAIVDKLLAKNPDDRFQTPAELADALTLFTTGHDLPALLVDSPHAAAGSADREAAGVTPTTASTETLGDVAPVKPVLAETFTRAPQPSPAGSSKIPKNHIKIAAAFFGGLISLAGLIVILLPTSNGTIRIEINDPSIEVTVNENGYRIQGLEEDVEIKPGEHTLHVKRGDIEFDTDKFKVNKLGEVVVQVEYIEGTLRVVSNDKELGSRKPSMNVAGDDPDRAAAQLVLSLGGTMRIRQGAPQTLSELNDPQDIPDGPFRVESISLTGNQNLTGVNFAPLRGLEELQAIWAANSNISDSLLEHLGDCTNLVYLDCNNSPHVTDAGLQHLRGLTKLYRLDLNGAKVSDNGLKHLQNLKQLNGLSLSSTDVTDAGMQHLSGLTKLTLLGLHGTAVTGKGLAVLKGCSALDQLGMQSTATSDQDLAVLSAFPNLESLSLDSRQLTTIGAEHLTKLPKLSVLDVNLGVDGDPEWTGEALLAMPNLTRLTMGRQATDTQMKHVASLKNLAILIVQWSPGITDQGCLELKMLPDLETLILAGVKSAITDKGLDHLASIKSLRELRLDGSKVTPDGIARFKAALPNCKVTTGPDGQAVTTELPETMPSREGRPTDAELLQRLTKVDWKPGRFDSELDGCVAAPAEVPGIPRNWQIVANSAEGSLSSTGKYILRGSGPSIVVSAKTGRFLSGHQLPAGVRIRDAAWSSDDNYVAFYKYGQGQTCYIRHVDGVSLQSSFLTGLTMYTPLSWSPAGDKLAASGTDGPTYHVRIFDISGKLLRAISDHGEIRFTGWSPDGKYLLLVDAENRLPVVEVATGKVVCEARPTPCTGYVRWLWSPDSRKVFVRDTSGHFAVTSVPDGHKEEEPYIPDGDWISCFSPDGRYSIRHSGEIRDLVGKVISKLDLTLVPGERRFFWDEPNRIRVMSAYVPGSWAEYSVTGRVLAKSSRLPTKAWFDHVTWSGDEERVIAVNMGNQVHGATGRQFRWSVDGSDDSTLAFPAVLNHWDWDIRVPTAYHPIDLGWFYAQQYDNYQFDPLGKLIATFGPPARRYSFSPDGKFIAVAGEYGVEIREKDKRVRGYEGLSSVPHGVLWNSNGTHLCGWDYDGTVCVWDAQNEQPIYQSSELHADGDHEISPITAPRWSPDGEQLAWFSSDSLHLVSVKTRQETKLSHGDMPIAKIRWTPDGKALLIDGDLYDLTGMKVATVPAAKNTREFEWTGLGHGAVAIRGTEALIWDSIKEDPVRIPLPQESRDTIRPADCGANGYAFSPSGQYWATVSTQNVDFGFDHGDVLLIDLWEKKLVWTGLGYSDGAMIRVGDSGRITSGPDEIDRYLTYVIGYPEGHTVPLTQLQFAARIGASPEQQQLQRVLDLGGQLQVTDREAPLTAADVSDARELPPVDQVVGISLASSYFVNGDTLKQSENLTVLSSLDLSNSRVKDVDLGALLGLANLRTLNLSGTGVTNKVSAALPAGLENLDLSGTSVGDLLLTDLRSIQSLRRLNLTGTKVTRQGIDSLRGSLPDCEIECVAENRESAIPPTESDASQPE